MTDPTGTVSLAQSHGRAGRHADALAAAEQAITLDPNLADAHFIRGVALEKLNRPADAVEALRKALALSPDHLAAMRNLGAILSRADNDAARREAVELLQRVAKRLPADGNIAGALGNALRGVGRIADAAAVFRKAADRHPRIADLRGNLGVCLQELADLSGAVECFTQALAVDPNHVQAHWNLALALLSRGEFARGWLEFEWRRRLPNDRLAREAPLQPQWNGCDITGRTILLRGEQGLGDVIQFVRYADLVKQRVGSNGRVILECQPALVSLLRRAPGVDDVIAQGQARPRFDVHAALMSLPAIFATTLETIPAATPYLSATAEKLALWKQRLAGLGAGLKIGIAWQGSRGYAGDHMRSIPLEKFAPLLQIDGVRLISLQKGEGASLPWLICFDQDDRAAGAFEDTAAIIANLDQVITSDTSIAHLAGALGAKTWVALCHAPDWRWLAGREDCPWYPSMRLFRQDAPGDWINVFQRIAAALWQFTGAPTPLSQITAPISAGELVDRITILQIKQERIADADKLSNVRTELAELRRIAQRHLPQSKQLEQLACELSEVNQALWDVEDLIRCPASCESDQFTALARSVPLANDRRAALKRAINSHLGSRIVEEKSYAAE